MTDTERDEAWRREAVLGIYAERPLHEPPRNIRIWSYADRLSYAPGETARLSVCTNAKRFAVEIIRDGAAPKTVFARDGLEGVWRDTPDDCSVKGCGWPVSLEIPIALDWPSGGYIIRTRAAEEGRGADMHEHIFLVRPHAGSPRRGRLLLVAATATWTAYNDWGGSNHYQGYCGPNGDRFSPVLSLERPLARGFVSLPADAPRAVLMDQPPIMAEPRYPHMEWAYANGYSKKYMSSGWASFERHFVTWAERQGYALDIVSQTDLHFRPELLEAYPCVVLVGHDEYWSWDMRDAIDAYVAKGGRIARFAGNFMWQIRLENEGRTQVCYKYLAREEDPFMKTGPRSRVTESWEAPEIGRPGAASFGLNATHGLYASWSGCSPRGAKGFPVYRPEHWAFADTGLYYGDILGAESRIFGYEVDGLPYEIRGGLPHALEGSGAPEGIEILALGLSSTIEEGPTILPGRSFLGTEDGEYVASVLTGRKDAEAIERTKRGCGMIVNFRKGAGEVFHAGTCDWIMGLTRRDAMVEQVTRNVLDRFLG
ncbi:N,N-dimethylformamidase beta subunit family domain-containing protein [Aestuariivirga sp.]|uniref:N,N-dimethylformamidase beta subunit family domain-containing protein n=1 Tax=Aestuariivirga sp. TaxID=2650926 RepID=UPI00391A4CD2